MRWLAVLILVPVAGFASDGPGGEKSRDRLAELVATYYSTEKLDVESREDLFTFAEKLRSKRKLYPSDQRFLSHAFYKTHQKFLRTYSEFSTFSQLFDKGVYNCLTATALYGLILDYLQYRYEITETNYHIFIIVETDAGRLLLETTDRRNGFVADPGLVAARIASYKKYEPVGNDSRSVQYYYTRPLFNSIDLLQLAGLMHYNQAVQAYNSDNIEGALTELENAVQLYQSSRIEELSKLIAITLHARKEAYPKTVSTLLSRVNQILTRNTDTFASL